VTPGGSQRDQGEGGSAPIADYASFNDYVGRTSAERRRRAVKRPMCLHSTQLLTRFRSRFVQSQQKFHSCFQRPHIATAPQLERPLERAPIRLGRDESSLKHSPSHPQQPLFVNKTRHTPPLRGYSCLFGSAEHPIDQNQQQGTMERQCGSRSGHFWRFVCNLSTQRIFFQLGTQV
jgi:hypothetical protein